MNDEILLDERTPVRANVEGGHIYVGTPFSEENRAICKSINGSTWDKGRKRWKVPATPSAAQSVRDAFADKTRFELRVNREFVDLFEQAQRAVAARAHKTADDLPDFPGKTEGWNHQRQGYHFAYELDAAMLEMGMGTGKSKVVVGLCEGWNVNLALILCPSSVVDVWPEQYNGPLEVPDPQDVSCPMCDGEGVVQAEAGATECPLCEGQKHILDDTRTKLLPYGHAVRNWNVLALDKSFGTVKERVRAAESAAALASDRYPVAIVINYEAAIREPFKKWSLAQKWDLVALDESHKVKAPGGVTAKYVASLRTRARKRLCTTGTSMPHSELDVYSQYRFLDPGIFGTSHYRFKLRYAVMGGYQDKVVMGMNPDTRAEFEEKFASIAYICGEEVLDLPESVPPEQRKVTMSEATQRIYDQLDEDLIADVGEGVVTATNALTRLLRLQQATSGHSKTDDERVVVIGKEKRELLKSVLEEIGPNEPVIVFTRFVHDAVVCEELCSELGLRFGAVNGQRNDLESARYPKNVDLLAVQMQSGGVGINLTRSRYAIYYSVGYSLGEYLQSRKRYHRPGQTRTSYTFHLVAEREAIVAAERETVDGVVFKALKRRQNVIGATIQRAKELA